MREILPCAPSGRRNRTDPLAIDHERMVARAEAKCAAQVRKPHEDRTEAAAAFGLWTIARNTVRQCKPESLPVIIKVREVSAALQLARMPFPRSATANSNSPYPTLYAAIPVAGLSVHGYCSPFRRARRQTVRQCGDEPRRSPPPSARQVRSLPIGATCIPTSRTQPPQPALRRR
jgi:hypothetical protein